MPSVFQSSVAECIGAIDEGMLKALRAAADIGRNAVVQNLSGTRSGIRYKVPGTQTYYTASSPGEYPAVATGNLKQSVKIVQEGDAFLIGTDVDYGLALEKKPGSEGGREWLRPSLEGVRPEMEEAASKRWF